MIGSTLIEPATPSRPIVVTGVEDKPCRDCRGYHVNTRWSPWDGVSRSTNPDTSRWATPRLTGRREPVVRCVPPQRIADSPEPKRLSPVEIARQALGG